MSFQSLKRLLTDCPYGACVQRQLLLVGLALVAVLVAAGQLARAAGGPGPDDIQDSLPGWNADGTRVSFDRTAPGLQHIVTMSAAGKDLYVASSAGAFRGFLPGGVDPAYMLVQANGDTTLTIGGRFAGPAAEVHGVDATASPDGTQLAYLRDGTLYVAQLDSVNLNSFPIPVPAESAVATGIEPPHANTIAFISDTQRAKGGATQYQYALYVKALDGGVAHKLVDDVHPYSPPRWSPTAALIAVAAGQECRRWGIYVGRSEVGSRFTRRSNLCRYTGTTAGDRIGGSEYFDIINGLGGNDALLGRGGNDALYGENGDDRIAGGAGDDFILGGPGDDRLYGGPGDDVIIGGNGRDVIDCGPGNDTVEGAGPLDTIAKNCERVKR